MMGRLLRDWQPGLLVASLLLLFYVSSFLVGRLMSARDVAQIFIWVIFVVALYTYTGVTGVVSFGHTAFSSIGAFVAAILTINPVFKSATLVDLPEAVISQSMSPWLALPVGIAVAAVAACPVAAAVGRLRGEAASIGTFAFLLALYALMSNWDGVTGGATALVGVPVVANKHVAFSFSLFAVLVAWVFRASSWGRQLVAGRDDETAAIASGVNVRFLRFVAFVLGAILMALAGIVQIYAIGVVSVDSFYVGTTSLILAMLVVGGRNSFSGAVIGALVVSSASVFLRRLEDGVSLGGVTFELPGGTPDLVIATLMLFVLIRYPQGLMRYSELRLRRAGAGRPSRR